MSKADSPVPLAVAAVALLGATAALPRVHHSPTVLWTVLAATGVFAAWLGWLVASARRGRRTLRAQVVVRRAHWVQPLCQGAVYAYWAAYVPEVVDNLPLLAVQFVFAYLIDLVMSWTRRRPWILGFGPLPIVVSTNLFLWFKDDWFFLQLAMVAAAFLSREYLRWKRNGQNVHIFNPSAFGLFVASVALIALRGTDLTWGPEIATTLIRAPHMYLCIFGVGLVVQLLFGVCLVTMASALTVFAGTWLWHATTGIWFFGNDIIPVAVFLGAHLLVTDPSTSPRSNSGRVVFGVLYGLAVFPLYAWLLAIDTPAFYDKLLQVPLLNLLVPAIERGVGRLRVPGPWARWKAAATDRLHVAVWSGAFVLMAPSVLHPPSPDPAAWLQACRADDAHACRSLRFLYESLCNGGTAAPCALLGDVYGRGDHVARDDAKAVSWYSRGCELGGARSCAMLAVAHEQGLAGLAASPADAAAYRERACDGGDEEACTTLAARLVEGQGLPRDPGRAATILRGACERGLASPCAVLGYMSEHGQGIPADATAARALYGRACDRGLAAACRQRDALR